MTLRAGSCTNRGLRAHKGVLEAREALGTPLRSWGEGRGSFLGGWLWRLIFRNEEEEVLSGRVNSGGKGLLRVRCWVGRGVRGQRGVRPGRPCGLGLILRISSPAGAQGWGGHHSQTHLRKAGARS